MKKILPYIFILTIIVQLFAPFSVSQNGLNKNKAEAEFNYQIEVTATVEENNLKVEIKPDPTYTFDVSEGTGKLLPGNSNIAFVLYLFKKGGQMVGEEPVVVSLHRGNRDYDHEYKNLENGEYELKIEVQNVWGQFEVSFWKFITFRQLTVFSLESDRLILDQEFIRNITIPKNSDIEQNNEIGSVVLSGTAYGNPDDVFECNITGNFRGCVAETTYLVLFKPSAFLFGLTGKAMDFALNYSLNDNSYRSVFVVKGWGIVRDICNIFFIFILLYIAFQVVLGLGGKGKDPKSLVINVIIIGLVINFSLFATRFIIDASNILSRVFYNTEIINLGEENEPTGNYGEIRLSEALVTRVNPVQLISNPEKIENINVVGENPRYGAGTNVSNNLPISLGGFILVCILSALICIVGMVVFFNLAFVFIARVVMLWIAMILSPVAFFSYITPGLAKQKMIGLTSWLKETVSMAFVAPVFCFFMYIIISFLDSGLGLITATAQNSSGAIAGGFDFVISIMVPFAFLMVLLMKVKKIAISMSGEAGEIISKAGSTISGAALGLATGGAAMAMRGTIGRMGSKMASSKKWSDMEEKGGFQGFVGRNMRNVGLNLGSKSFDIRNTKIGEGAAKQLGVSGTIKSTMSSGSKPKVGIIGNREEKIKRMEEQQTRRDKYRPKTEDQKKVDELTEEKVKLNNRNSAEVKRLEEDRDKAEKELKEKEDDYRLAENNRKDALNKYNAAKGTSQEDSARLELEKAQKEASAKLSEVNEAKKEFGLRKQAVANIKGGGSIVTRDKDGNIIASTLPNGYNTTNGNITQELYTSAVSDYKKAEEEEEKKKKELEQLENSRQGKEDDARSREKDKIDEIQKDTIKKKSDEEKKKTDAIRSAKIYFGREIKAAETKLSDIENDLITYGADPVKTAELTAKKAETEKKIEELKKNKISQVSRITTEANSIYKKAIQQLNKDEELQISQTRAETKNTLGSISENITKAQKEFGEATIKAMDTKEVLDVADRAKSYAEQNGGFGQSESGLDKEIVKTNTDIKKQDNDRMINRADRLANNRNIFDAARTSGLTSQQIQERRNRIFNTLNQ